MDIYINAWKKLRNLTLLSGFWWLGWVPCGFLAFYILKAILPEEMLPYSMIVVVLFWWSLHLVIDWRLSNFRCPRCNMKYFKKALFSSLRSNCSYCGLRVNETQETEAPIQQNPVPEFDAKLGQFMPYRILGSLFLFGGAWITIEGLIALLSPEMTVTVNGAKSTNTNDKIIVTLFGLPFFLIGCAVTIFPVKIARGINGIARRIKTKLHFK